MRKILFILLFALTASLSGCGNDDAQPQNEHPAAHFQVGEDIYVVGQDYNPWTIIDRRWDQNQWYYVLHYYGVPGPDYNLGFFESEILDFVE